MRMQLASIAIAVAAVCPRLAAADIDVERQRARVHLQHGAVIVDAELVLRNRSRSAAALDWTVSLPDQSTVTELRVRRAGRWQKAEVLPEKQARKRYDASITIASKLGHLGPLIAEWGDDSSFSLALWPVPARRSVAIRYRATSYPCIYAGHLAVEMPDGGGALEVQGGRQLKSKSKLHTELVDNCSDIDGHGPVVAFRLPGRGLQASWANRKLSERSIADLRLLAGTLSRQPVGASVVFVLDGSYSQGEAGIRTQIARVRDFAAELPSGRYQLVVYRRYAHPLLPGWTSGRELGKVLDRLPARLLVQGNGSRLDRGLATALSLLSGRAGIKRVVAFTDERLASTTSPRDFGPELAGLAPTGTIVHLARADGSEHDRIWDGVFADLAKQLGGIYAVVSRQRTRSSRSMTELVRPQVLERLTVKRADGTSDDDLPELSELREGQGLSHLFALSRPSSAVVVEGMLWTRRVRQTLRSRPAYAHHLGAYAVAADWLTEAEGRALAIADGLLSKWTAMIALPKRPVAPQRGHGGQIGFGISGTSSCCGCRGGRSRRLPLGGELLLALEAPVRGCMARHGQSFVALEVETTGLEIVDVRTKQSTPLAKCIAEAVWELRAVGSGASYETTRFAIEPGPKIRTTGGTVSASRSAW